MPEMHGQKSQDTLKTAMLKPAPQTEPTIPRLLCLKELSMDSNSLGLDICFWQKGSRFRAVKERVPAVSVKETYDAGEG